MTIPTRPAPPPPPPSTSMTRTEIGRMAAPTSVRPSLMTNMNLQQTTTMTNTVTVPKLTIKLPPPPKGPTTQATNMSFTIGSRPGGHNHHNNNSNNSSITRSFPKARYNNNPSSSSSAINSCWPNESSFENLIYANSSSVSSGRTESNTVPKKVPPPRPPPPKLMMVNGKKGLAPRPPPSLSLQQSKNILNQLFHRKKKEDSKAQSMMMMTQMVVTKSLSTTSTTTTSTTKAGGFTTFSTASDWNSAWTTTTTTTTDAMGASNELQLISFDSPPSSPTFTQKSNSDCLSMDSFSSDSNFSSPNNGSVSQPESGFEDEFSVTVAAAAARSRPATTTPPKDPWEAIDLATSSSTDAMGSRYGLGGGRLGGSTVPVRNLQSVCSKKAVTVSGGGLVDNPLCNGKSLLPPPPILKMPTIIKPRLAQKPKAPKPPPPHPTSSIEEFPPPPSTLQGVSNYQTPVPAGSSVSLLDVITGKADALQLDSCGYEMTGSNGRLSSIGGSNSESPFGIALYNFDSDEIGDLCFREMERIYLLEKVNDEWYRGRNRSGCEGIFPASYISVKVPLKEVEVATAGGVETRRELLMAKCLYNFPADVEGDLQLKEDEMVSILYRINGDWLYGETADGRRGQFPANFLERVPDDIPTLP